MSFKIFNGLPTTDQIIREYAATGQLRCGASFALDQSAIDQKARSVSGTASVEEVSRTRLFIDVEGIDLSGFKKNPVVLAGHHDVVPSTLMPAVVALVGSISKKEGSLIFRNMTFDQDELSEAWFQKITRGFVRMVSVGIVPQDAEFVEEEVGRGDKKKLIRYVRVNQSELVEISVVPIGANRGAFIDPPKQERESVELAALRQELDLLNSALDGVHGGSDDDDGIGESYGDASFPDSAFIVEHGVAKEDGKTVQKYRHLPHHTRGVRSGTDNSTVDIPHLRNALARVNQVKPVSESKDSYVRRAKAHLEAHARVLLKSHMESLLDIERMLVSDSSPSKVAEVISLCEGIVGRPA